MTPNRTSPLAPLLFSSWMCLSTSSSMGCGSGEPMPAAAGAAQTASAADQGPQASASPADPGGPPRAPNPAPNRAPNRRDDSIADDYSVMMGDCHLMAARFGKLVEAESLAQLDPKLAESKRKPLEEKTRAEAEEAGAKWAEVCRKSLVGKTMAPASIKCALGAGSVAAFEKCLSG